ncbi:MAG: choice-of-anchor L domain-containing protein, partial [Flavisolibacter sp.]
MCQFKRLLFFLLLICTSQTLFSQLQIVPQTSGQALAQKLVGSGVIISNVHLSGSKFSTAFFYNQGNTKLGIDSGIVLTTGRAITADGYIGLNGPQTLLASNQMAEEGDDQLDDVVAPSKTTDAVILEFDFTPVGDSVRFKYVFSSEEYPTYVCSKFNDVFAFFISGPG